MPLGLATICSAINSFGARFIHWVPNIRVFRSSQRILFTLGQSIRHFVCALHRPLPAINEQLTRIAFLLFSGCASFSIIRNRSRNEWSKCRTNDGDDENDDDTWKELQPIDLVRRCVYKWTHKREKRERGKKIVCSLFVCWFGFGQSHFHTCICIYVSCVADAQYLHQKLVLLLDSDAEIRHTHLFTNK